MHMNICETREKKTRSEIKRNNIPAKGNRGSNIGNDAVIDQYVHLRKTARRINLSAAKNDFHETYLLQIKLIYYSSAKPFCQGQEPVFACRKNGRKTGDFCDILPTPSCTGFFAAQTRPETPKS